MDADAHLNVTLARLGAIASGDGPLDFHRALRGLERAGKLDEEAVTGGLDLAAIEQRELPALQALIFGDQFQRERLVALGERAVTHHVGEHDGGELALLGVFRRHSSIRREAVPVIREYDPGLVNVASLQFGEEVARVHGAFFGRFFARHASARCHESVMPHSASLR